jgi:SAM-dependent methyltransferase
VPARNRDAYRTFYTDVEDRREKGWTSVRTDYTEVFQDADAVSRYQRVVYAPGTWASVVSARQRRFLRALVARRFETPPVLHDFACGTGRVLRALSGRVSAAHGYDSSVEMLASAADTAADTEARLHVVDVDGPVPRPIPTDGPALVTIFRLFLNAPPELRDRALSFAAAALPNPASGFLVIENHGNRRSLRHTARRLRRIRRARHTARQNAWFAELSHAEVTDALSRHGFEVVERRGFALLPQGAYRRRWLRPLARLIDATTRLPALSAISTDVLYVAQRTI